MFSANKFDSFKQSLATLGKNSQAQPIQNSGVIQASQPTTNNVNNLNIITEQNTSLPQSNPFQANNINAYNYNSAVVSPKNSNVINKPIYNSGVPASQAVNSNNSTPIETIINYNFESQRNNPNNNRGTIRSALKFDY